MKKQNKLFWKTELRKVSDLVSNKYNARVISEKMRGELKKSIDKFSYIELIVIDTDNRVLSGNQRLSVLMESDKKDSEIEVRVPSRKLSKKEFDQYSLIANRVHGDFDWDKLADYDIDLLLDSGFDEMDLTNVFDDLVEVEDDEYNLDKEIKKIKKTNIKTGEIYKLGEHYLAVGDCTDSELLKKLFGDKKINCVACDINYNQKLDYGKGAGGKAHYADENPVNDNRSISEYEEFMRKSMKVIFPHLDKDSHWFWFCSQNYVWMVQKLYMELGITLRRLCSWFKLNGNPTPNVAFNASTESCIYGTINSPYLSKKVLNLTEILNKEIGVGNRAYDDILDIIDLWVVKRVNNTEQEHACQKPPSLYEKMLRRTTKPGDIVYDGFCGSGSSIMACEQLKRKCYAVEIYPLFAQIILNRYEKLTGTKPIKIS